MARSSSRSSKPPRILSHYRLLQLLGSGAMGSVYQGVDRRDDSSVAVKILHPYLTRDKTYRERFEREAHIGVLLRSPYTVHLLDYGVQADHYFIVMEYVEGTTLRTLMEPGPLPTARALEIAVQIARALEEAAARGVVHRDIKPDNILVGPDDAVKVADFGISRQLSGGTLTMPGGFLGTLSYAAPEQFMGITDHRSDIYSAGATLYDILTGRPPFRGTMEEMAAAVRNQPLDLRPLAGQPPAVVEIIKRCLDKDPEHRYQTASELAADLERAARACRESMESAPTVVEPIAATEYVLPDTLRSEQTVADAIEDKAVAAPEAARPQPPAADAIENKAVAAPEAARPQPPAADTIEDKAVAAPEAARPEPPAAEAIEEKAVGVPDIAPESSPKGRPRGIVLVAAAAAVLVGAVALAFVVFGGSSGGGTAAIGEKDLKGLVLAADDLGAAYSAFQSAFLGPVTNPDVAKTACPGVSYPAPGTERVSGYRSVLQAPAGAPAAQPQASPPAGQATSPAQSSVFLASTEIELFTSHDAAEKTVQGFEPELIANPRVVNCADMTPQGGVLDFPSDGIGEDSRGAELGLGASRPLTDAAPQLGLREETRRLTVVRFVRQNLVGTAIVGDRNGQPQRAEAVRIAQLLDDRVRAALGEPSPTPPIGPVTAPPVEQPPVQTIPVQPPQPTQAPPPPPPPTSQPTPQPTPQPTLPPAQNYITTGTWAFAYTVTYNDCGFGPTEGTLVPHAISLYEATYVDGYISDGEMMAVYDLDSTFIGDFVFSYPEFTFESPLQGGDTVVTTLDFSGPSDGLATREEYYPTSSGECLIYFEERPL